MSTATPVAAGTARLLAGKPAAKAPQRIRQAVLPIAPRPAFRVLQTSRAPAQLSLFLRPGLGNR